MRSQATMHSTSRRHFALVVLSFLLSSSGVSSLLAQAPASEPAQVLVILARSEAGEVTPELKKIEALQKPPFSSFQSMTVLTKTAVKATTEKPVVTDLPNGRKMQLELLEFQGGRYKVRVSINKPGAQDYLPGMVVMASPGEPFFVAGQKYEGGTLIIGVTMGTKPKK